MNPFLSFFSQHRKSVVLALGLVIIENVAWILEPTVFGNVIDAFVDKSLAPTSAEFLTPLLIWIGVFLVNSGVGAVRRMVDPRIYLRIYTQMAVDIARKCIARNQSISKTAARADLIREYITFFQYRLPEIIEQSIAIGGALIAMAFFDLRIAVACAIALIPLGYGTASFSKRIQRIQESLHDTREAAYDTFSTKDLAHIEGYYSTLAANETAIARLTGFSFGILRVILLAIFLVVLYISIDLDNFSTGNIFSIVAYIWTFIGSTEYVPELMESWASLKELNARLAADGAEASRPRG
jgi:ABC-type multidrug transport system fused ATPase/permease subunit